MHTSVFHHGFGLHRLNAFVPDLDADTPGRIGRPVRDTELKRDPENTFQKGGTVART